MPEGSSGQEYFTGQTLGRRSGAVAITLVVTTGLFIAFEFDKVLTGFLVALVVSVAAWLQEVAKGNITIDKTFTWGRKIAHALTMAFLVLVNGFLIFASASGTGSILSDATHDAGASDEESVLDQALAAWTGTARAEDELATVSGQADSVLQHVLVPLQQEYADLNDDYQERGDSLATTTERLAVLEQSDRGELLAAMDQMEAAYTASLDSLHGVAEARGSQIAQLQTEMAAAQASFMESVDSLSGIITVMSDSLASLQGRTLSLEPQGDNLQGLIDALGESDEGLQILLDLQERGLLPAEYDRYAVVGSP